MPKSNHSYKKIIIPSDVQDELLTALFSNHQIVLQKLQRQEEVPAAELEVYNLTHFLDESHLYQLDELLKSVVITNFNSAIPQAEILENIVGFLERRKNLTELLASVGQRNLEGIIGLLTEESKQELAKFLAKRYQRHLYLPTMDAVKNTLFSTTAPLALLTAIALSTGFVSIPIAAISGLAIVGGEQYTHNLASKFRCLLIAEKMHIKLDLDENFSAQVKNFIQEMQTPNKLLTLPNLESTQEEKQQKPHARLGQVFTFFQNIFSAKQEQQKEIEMQDITEIELEEIPQKRY